MVSGERKEMRKEKRLNGETNISIALTRMKREKHHEDKFYLKGEITLESWNNKGGKRE